jgi:uncharacterized delta-60 repeat protein
MAKKSFKVKNSVNITPIDPLDIENPESGDIIIDSTDSNRLKVFNPDSNNYESPLAPDVPINELAEKTVPASNDVILIEDSADSFAKKKVKVSNLGTGSGGGDTPVTVSLTNNTSTTSTGIPLSEANGAYIDYSVTRQLVADGVLDSEYSTESSGSAAFNNTVRSLDLDYNDSSKLLVGGSFTSYKASGTSYSARLLSTGERDTTYTNGAGDAVYVIRAADGGGVYVAGRVAVYDLSKFQDDGFTPATGLATDWIGDEISGGVGAKHITDIKERGGKVCVTARLMSFDGPGGTSNHATLLNSDLSMDSTFQANLVGKLIDQTAGTVWTCEIQSDGKVFFGGLFTSYGGVIGDSRLVRLNPNGTVDTAFMANINGKFSNAVHAINIQSDGKILVGGVFTNYDGVTDDSYLVRLNPDGTKDTAFMANINGKFLGSVLAIEIQSDGKILAGGAFTNYDGVTGLNRFIRLNSDGTLDSDYSSNAAGGAKFSTEISAIKAMNDGKVAVGGAFTNYDGVTGLNRLVVLDADGKAVATQTATGRVHKAPMSSTITNAYSETGTSGITWTLSADELHWSSSDQTCPVSGCYEGTYEAKVIVKKLE